MAEALISRGCASAGGGGGGGAYEFFGSAAGDGTSNALTVDLSVFDLTQYDEIKIVATGGEAPGSTTTCSLHVFVNSAPTGSAGTINASSFLGGSGFGGSIELFPDEVTGGCFYKYQCYYFSRGTTSAKSAGGGGRIAVAPSQISYFSFGTYANGKWLAMPSTMRVSVYGLKRGV